MSFLETELNHSAVLVRIQRAVLVLQRSTMKGQEAPNLGLTWILGRKQTGHKLERIRRGKDDILDRVCESKQIAPRT